MSSNTVTKATLGKNSFQIDSSGGTGDTYGILSGSVNGGNTVFTVSLGSYVSGSLEVQLNGQLLTQGDSEDWTETSPSSGTFTFDIAPEVGDTIIVKYQYQTVTTGNADTLDGHHSTDFVTNTVAGEFENKIVDATKNTISNLDVDNLASGVLDTDLSSVSANDDTIPSAKSTKTYADTKIAKTTNVTSINDTGIADGEIAVFNLTSKDIRTSDKTLPSGTVVGTSDTQTLTGKTIDGDDNTLQDIGSGSLKNTVGFDAYRTGAITLTHNNFTKITCGTEVFDSGSNYDSSTNYRFTAPVTGVYHFDANVHVASLGDGYRLVATLYVNGAEAYRGEDISFGAASDGGVGVSRTIKLTANDYVEFYVYLGGAADKSTLNNAIYNHFSGYLVGKV